MFQELEKLGARKLRMTARNVLQTAEKLYTAGFISYPRTETNIFPKVYATVVIYITFAHTR